LEKTAKKNRGREKETNIGLEAEGKKSAGRKEREEKKEKKRLTYKAREKAGWGAPGKGNGKPAARRNT